MEKYIELVWQKLKEIEDARPAGFEPMFIRLEWDVTTKKPEPEIGLYWRQDIDELADVLHRPVKIQNNPGEYYQKIIDYKGMQITVTGIRKEVER